MFKLNEGSEGEEEEDEPVIIKKPVDEIKPKPVCCHDKL